MSPYAADSLSNGFENLPGSHLRGVEDISPEVPLSFGIRRVWTAAVDLDSIVLWIMFYKPLKAGIHGSDN